MPSNFCVFQIDSTISDVNSKTTSFGAGLQGTLSFQSGAETPAGGGWFGHGGAVFYGMKRGPRSSEYQVAGIRTTVRPSTSPLR